MTARVSPSALRHRVQVQARSSSQDTFGQEVQTWATVLAVFAAIEPSLGRSQLSGEAQTSTVTHVVTIRWRAGITARMRLLYGSRVFEIESVVDVEERHFWLELQCVEGLTQG